MTGSDRGYNVYIFGPVYVYIKDARSEVHACPERNEKISHHVSVGRWGSRWLIRRPCRFESRICRIIGAAPNAPGKKKRKKRRMATQKKKVRANRFNSWTREPNVYQHSARV